MTQNSSDEKVLQNKIYVGEIEVFALFYPRFDMGSAECFAEPFRRY